MYEGCPYCGRVTDALESIGVEVALKDIFEDPKAMSELMAARQRRTVPVLKIRGHDGTERWMPESADIVRYLTERFR